MLAFELFSAICVGVTLVLAIQIYAATAAFVEENLKQANFPENPILYGKLCMMIHVLSLRAGVPEPTLAMNKNIPELEITWSRQSKAVISVNPEWLKRFTLVECMAAFAHEIGHLTRPIGLLVFCVLHAFVMSLYITSTTAFMYWLLAITSPAPIPETRTVALLMYAGYFSGFVISAFSSFLKRRDEYAVDMIAANLLGEIAPLTDLFDAFIYFGGSDTESLKGKYSLRAIFSTHPSLPERIERLKMNAHKVKKL